MRAEGAVSLRMPSPFAFLATLPHAGGYVIFFITDTFNHNLFIPFSIAVGQSQLR